MISVRDVHKVFRQGEAEVRALAGVSLDIAAGEFVSIMGPSGSGKSTLLHLMGGLDVPTAGEIVIDGTPISRMSDDEITIFRRRRIGFVFQFFNLLPTYSAEENVALPLLLDRRRPRDVREQMQRVAIARALVIDPALILADEPTGNLDTRTGEQILALIRDANRARGSTVVLVTHDARAAGHAARIVTLKDGTVVNGAPA